MLDCTQLACSQEKTPAAKTIPQLLEENALAWQKCEELQCEVKMLRERLLSVERAACATQPQVVPCASPPATHPVVYATQGSAAASPANSSGCRTKRSRAA